MTENKARKRTQTALTVEEYRSIAKTPPKQRKRAKPKGLIHIEAWLKLSGIKYVSEYQFAKPRKYRADLYLPEHNILIEYEGLMSEKSRHSTITGYTGDCNKYNLAVSLGYKLFRFTVLNYKTISDLINGTPDKLQH